MDKICKSKQMALFLKCGKRDDLYKVTLKLLKLVSTLVGWQPLAKMSLELITLFNSQYQHRFGKKLITFVLLKNNPVLVLASTYTNLRKFIQGEGTEIASFQ